MGEKIDQFITVLVIMIRNEPLLDEPDVPLQPADHFTNSTRVKMKSRKSSAVFQDENSI